VQEVKMRRRVILIVASMLVLLVGGFVLRILWLTGSFKQLAPHFDGHCRLVAGPVGPEDITINPKTGLAYISASDRRARAAGKPVPGAIFVYDLNQAGAQPVNLTPRADLAFQPHGISLWVEDDGRAALFVINHPESATDPNRNAVEIFDVYPGGLVHRATLTDPLLVMPNDLVAVGMDRFYLTNTHRHPPGLRQTAETYLQLAGAQVLYYGFGGFRVALDNLVLPNGINVSPDGQRLYLALTTNRSMRVYDRDPATERLTVRQEIFLGSGPDNIEIDPDGNAWIGAHPKLLRIAAHRDNPAELSPSQVFRVSPNGKVDEIYLNDGSELSGSSVAAVSGRRLLIGQIFDNGFLDCELGSTARTQG
jgi:arylesterase / paraoxonase